MKRSPLKRKSALKRSFKLKRSAIKRKPRRNDDLEARKAWEAEHQVCASCGFRPGLGEGWLETHHILDGKYGRPNEPWNWLRLCGRFGDEDKPPCHRLAEGERVRRRDGSYWLTISDGMCLTMKRESDPANFDLGAMQAHLIRLTRRRLAALEELPVEMLEQRAMNARKR